VRLRLVLDGVPQRFQDVLGVSGGRHHFRLAPASGVPTGLHAYRLLAIDDDEAPEREVALGVGTLAVPSPGPFEVRLSPSVIPLRRDGEVGAATLRFVFRGTPADAVRGISVVHTPKGAASLPLKQLEDEHLGQGRRSGNDYEFTWTDPGPGPYVFRITGETEGETWAACEIVTPDPEFRVQVEPSRVVRPASGTRPVTYRVQVRGAPPDRRLGVVCTDSPAGQGFEQLQKQAESIGAPAEWSRLQDTWVYELPWSIDATTAAGTWTYEVQSEDGRRAWAQVVIDEPEAGGAP
jgi:hypothetical protein